MSTYLRRPKLSDDVNEEEVQNNQQQTNDSSVSQQDNSRNYTQEFATVNAKIAELERRFNAEKQPLINQRTAIMQAAAKAGISLTTSESVNYKFSSKLYESVVRGSRTDELVGLIDSTFAALPDLSYYMDSRGCTSLAKRLLAFLNDQYWNDGQNQWSDIAEFVRGTLSKANISLSTKEMMKFIDELGNQMKGNTMYVWIFGNQEDEPEQEEVEEAPAVEEPVETPEEPVETPEEPVETLAQPVEEYPETDYPVKDITPEDEEVLADYAQPMEEVPEETYDEDEVLPEETTTAPITPEDEEELLQYATDYDDIYDDYELNEGKRISSTKKPSIGLSKFESPEEQERFVSMINDYCRHPKTFVNDMYIEHFGFEQQIQDFVLGLAKDEFNLNIGDEPYTVPSWEYEEECDNTAEFLNNEARRLMDAVGKAKGWKVDW